jgi:hypothetical protein
MDIATFIESTHTIDYNGKQYKLIVKGDKSVRLHDSFSNKELLFTTADAVYPDGFVAGFHEAFFIHFAIDLLLKK